MTNAIILPTLSKFQMTAKLHFPLGKIFERITHGAQTNNDVKTFSLWTPRRGRRQGFCWCSGLGGVTVQQMEKNITFSAQVKPHQWSQTKFELLLSAILPQVHGWTFHQRGICEITAGWVTSQLYTDDLEPCTTDHENLPQLQKQQLLCQHLSWKTL